MIKNADYGEILKRFEYTVREYIKFYDYYRNQNICSEKRTQETESDGRIRRQ